MEKINTIVDIEDMVNYYQEKQEHQKHLKGYIYDSLVYRYQIALYKASLKDAEDIMIKDSISRKEAEEKARKNYFRDLMKFCQILEEVIGEHD